MSHVTHMNESCHTYEWVMSHIWMSHVTHMTESCLTHTQVSARFIRWVMCNTRMSHVPHVVTESCLTHIEATGWILAWFVGACDWVMSHTHTHNGEVWSHVTLSDESCPTCDCVTSRTWMSHVAHVTESCVTHTHIAVTYGWVMSR